MIKHFAGVILLVAGILSPILCDDIDLEAIKSKLPAGITIPEDLSNITAQYERVHNYLSEKCKNQSRRNDAFDEAEDGAKTLVTCLGNLINATALKIEIDEASPIGELDTVFHKYCQKRETALNCITAFTTAIEPCLDESENNHKKTFVNIFQNLLNFVCYRDGDRIALFIAEKGPECFKQKKDGLIACMNTTFSQYVPKETDFNLQFPTLTMGQKQCNDMTTLQNCIVQELEGCEESTPANLVEAIFKYVRKETPCGSLQ